MAEKKVIELDVQSNLGSLKSQLQKAQREVYQMSEAFGATSKEAANAALKAAALKDAIADAKALTDAFNPDAKFNALSSSIGGALNGFQAFEGALGLVGVESKDLEKTLLKVQSAMALSQGLQGVFEAKDSFIQLGSVVKNTFGAMTTASKAFLIGGIGLLIAALAVAADAMGVFGDSTEEAEKKQKKLEKQLAATNAEIANTQKSTSEYGDILDAQTQREINNAKRRGASDEELTMIAYNGAKKRLSVLEEEVDSAMKLYLKYSKKGSQKQYDAAADALTKAQEQRDALKDELDAMDADIKSSQIKATEEKIKAKKEEAKKLKELEEEQKSERIKAELQARLDEEEGEKLRTQILIDAEQEKLDAKKAADEEYRLWKIEDTQLNFQIQDAQFQRSEELDKKRLENEKQRRKEAIQIAYDSLALISQITELFGRRNEKSARIAFGIDKAAKIASSTIATIEGTIEAWKTAQKSPLTAVFPAYPAVQASLTAAFGAVGIAKIAQTKFNSGTPNLDVPTPNSNIGGSGGTISPNFNVVGNSGINQLSQLQQKPMKAYVVSGDMTTAQALDRNRIENATLVQ
jgi:chromosome segregation ATPase